METYFGLTGERKILNRWEEIEPLILWKKKSDRDEDFSYLEEEPKLFRKLKRIKIKNLESEEE